MRPVVPTTATDLQNLLRKTGKPNTASTFVGPTQTHGTATPADSEGKVYTFAWENTAFQAQ